MNSTRAFFWHQFLTQEQLKTLYIRGNNDAFLRRTIDQLNHENPQKPEQIMEIVFNALFVVAEAKQNTDAKLIDIISRSPNPAIYFPKPKETP
jgi:hypothetical protein